MADHGGGDKERILDVYKTPQAPLTDGPPQSKPHRQSLASIVSLAFKECMIPVTIASVVRDIWIIRSTNR